MHFVGILAALVAWVALTAEAWVAPPATSGTTTLTSAASSSSFFQHDSINRYFKPSRTKRAASFLREKPLQHANTNIAVTGARRRLAVVLNASTVKPAPQEILAIIDLDSSNNNNIAEEPVSLSFASSSQQQQQNAPSEEPNSTNTNPFHFLSASFWSNPDNAVPKKMILNGLLLAVSFGYAAYTILNIDNGMTRGWTQSEIAMRIPLDNWSNYESSLAEKPVYTKTLINVVIYLLGDWLSQTAFQKRNVLDFDASRTLKNGFIGLCFGPLVHEYYQFSDRILPVDGPFVNRIEKIVMDQTIYLSIKASIYVAAVNLLAGESWATARENVQTKIAGIVFTGWKFWPLVHCITYSVIPARHRILWVNCVDLIWNAILASMSASRTPHPQAPTPTLEHALEAQDNRLAHQNQVMLMSDTVSGAVDADNEIELPLLVDMIAADEPIILGQELQEELSPGIKGSLFNSTVSYESTV